MMMRGREVKSLKELKEFFALDDLISAYCSGELEYFLRKCGEENKAEKLNNIPQNAYLLVRLYEILDIGPKLTEEEIRHYYA